MVRAYTRLLSYLKPHMGGFLAALGLMGVLALSTGLYAYLVGPLLEFLVTGGEAGTSAVTRLVPGLEVGDLDRDLVRVLLPGLMFAVALFKGVAYFGQFHLMGMTGQKVVVDLRRHLFRHLLTLEPGWYSRRHSGDLISRFTNDIARVEMAVTHAVASIIRDSLQVVVLLGVAFYLDWRLSIIAFGVLPAILFPVIRLARRLRKVTGQSNAVMGAITERIHEVVGGIRVVQAYGMEGHERRRFDDANDEFIRVMRRSFLVRAFSSPLMEVMAVGGLALTVYLASGAIAEGRIEASKFLSFFATVMLMYDPVKQLGRLGQFVITGAASAERVFEVLDQHPEVADAPDAVDLAPLDDALRFESVRVVYPREGGAGTVALDGVDLVLEKGRVLALVGPSGGGKSTLASLLPRFFDPTDGRVTLDGTDLRQARLESLRSQIALVSQDTVIFNDTVRENVVCGGAPLDDEALWEVLARAQARDFVAALPQGLDTPLGERGVTLSGGQRQRLAIARALARNAPILILDEATSALDTENERAVQAALAELMAGRTTLVIAHRLSTVRHADRIVVLDAGRVVESGAHDELLALGGLYRRLYDLQWSEEAGRPRQVIG